MARAPLSVQLYSLRDALDRDRRGVLRRLRDMGFRHVEPFGLGNAETPAAQREQDAQALGADLRAAGLAVSAVHLSIPEDVDAVIEEVLALDVTTAIVPNPKKVPGFDPHIYTDAARVDRFADTLITLADRFREAGVRLGYHNHEFEWAELPDGTPGFARLLDRLDPRIVVELDVYWAAVAGQAPADVVRLIGDRLVALHIKDGPARRGEPQLPLGEGEVDVRGAITAAPEGVWHVLEIDVTDHDRFDLIEANAAHLRDAGLSDWDPTATASRARLGLSR